MDALLSQLGLDKTFFVEFVLIAVLFVLLSKIYFKPFLKLFEIRHKRTVEDREAAAKLVLQAQSKLEEYKKLIAEERQAARSHFEQTLLEARQQEAEILGQAREQAKKITQEAVESIGRQKELMQKQIEADIAPLAETISERLLARKM